MVRHDHRQALKEPGAALLKRTDATGGAPEKMLGSNMPLPNLSLEHCGRPHASSADCAWSIAQTARREDQHEKDLRKIIGAFSTGKGRPNSNSRRSVDKLRRIEVLRKNSKMDSGTEECVGGTRWGRRNRLANTATLHKCFQEPCGQQQLRT